jgi:hypothetical protein
MSSLSRCEARDLNPAHSCFYLGWYSVSDDFYDENGIVITSQYYATNQQRLKSNGKSIKGYYFNR